jgi:short-subunit dehydrogenase
MVARDMKKMRALASRIQTETDVGIEILTADLTSRDDVAKVEARLRDDADIEILVNNAGSALPCTFLKQSSEDLTHLIELNVTTLTRFANAVAPRFARNGHGAIVNVASVVGLAPEIGLTAYGATKAFVLFLSQGLHLELGRKGVYVQAVLPSVTRTEIWQQVGRDVSKMDGVMEIDELVDAALVGFDNGEPVTIPSLPEFAQWQLYEAARLAMLPNFRQTRAAARYRRKV